MGIRWFQDGQVTAHSEEETYLETTHEGLVILVGTKRLVEVRPGTRVEVHVATVWNPAKEAPEEVAYTAGGVFDKFGKVTVDATAEVRRAHAAWHLRRAEKAIEKLLVVDPANLSTVEWANILATASRLGSEDALRKVPPRRKDVLLAALHIMTCKSGHWKAIKAAYEGGRFHFANMQVPTT